MTQRRMITTLVALCVNGVTACAAVTPSPAPADSVLPVHTTLPSASATPSPTPIPSEPEPSDLAAEIEIHALDPTLTDPVLEFASDGGAIIFSSGISNGPRSASAPDLWQYLPGPDAVPELVWSNPHRDHSIIKLDGDLGTLAFVDIPTDGSRAWDLWLIPRVGDEPILLDTHPGDEDVSSLVPSLVVFNQTIAWTAFDRGAGGPVSQLLTAEAPDWQPRVLAERPAAEAELWLPSLYWPWLAYTEVRYAADRASDERSVYLIDTTDPNAEPRRLDASGRATMPLATSTAIFWKEADVGFNMFNWGRMFQFDLATEQVSAVSIWPQEYVNYPSMGGRFIAWWGADAFSFGVYDTVRQTARVIATYTEAEQGNVLRPHISGDLLVWLYVDSSGSETYSELRWAFLPNAAADR